MPRLSELLHGDFVEKPTDEIIQRKALSRIAPDYAMLFFDHLHSEYLALKPAISDPNVLQLLDGLHEKRLRCELTWSDIYSFDLSLVQARPLENLIRKAYDARAKYRSIAGQKEYDEYVASKPPNLPEIQIDPDANPPQPKVIIERALRADLEYLLSKVYLYYAILPVRERLRDWLTNRAVLITIISVAVLMLGILFNVVVALQIFDSLKELSPASVPFVTLLTVVSAGIIGGCVSMLQRIQSAPSEGDALFNLAALNSGWKGIFLSPLYGGIFAALLFVLFAAGLLEGSAFPRISTPRRAPQATVSEPTPTPAPPASPSPSPGTMPSPSPPLVARASSSTSPSPSSSPSPNPNGATETASPSTLAAEETATKPSADAQTKVSPEPSPTPPPEGLTRFPVLGVEDFLKHTGPSDGTSYALLIIWSFIAGFAERLVPDTLNRLVTKNEKIQGVST